MHLEQAGAKLVVALDLVATRPNAVRVDDTADIFCNILLPSVKDCNLGPVDCNLGPGISKSP